MAGRRLKSGSDPIDEYAFEMWWNLRLEWESQEAGSATGTASDSLTAASRTGLDRLAAVAASEVESPVKSMVASETPSAKVSHPQICHGVQDVRMENSLPESWVLV